MIMLKNKKMFVQFLSIKNFKFRVFLSLGNIKIFGILNLKKFFEVFENTKMWKASTHTKINLKNYNKFQ